MYGGHSDNLATAMKLLELSEDLQRIQDLEFIVGLRPEATLVDWCVSGHFVPHLVGTVTGHPILGSRDIATSQLFFIDQEARVARTLSRWYRLGTSTAPTLKFVGH